MDGRTDGQCDFNMKKTTTNIYKNKVIVIIAKFRHINGGGKIPGSGFPGIWNRIKHIGKLINCLGLDTFLNVRQ